MSARILHFPISDDACAAMSIKEKLRLHGDVINRFNWILWNGDEVEVPVDIRLEERALQWILSNDFNTRVVGARALKFFRTDANEARLNALLTDPAFIIQRNPSARTYPVRQAAFNVLVKEWALPADNVVLREEIPSR